jgi:diguanylate cyclase (GGDEF)-like protein
MGFFIYAIRYDGKFFSVIFFSQILILSFLCYFHHYLQKEETEIKLKKEEYLEEINLLNLGIEKEGLARKSLFQRVEAYARLKSLAEKLSLCATHSEAAEILAERTSELFDGEQTTTILYLFHPHTGSFGLSAAVKKGAKVNILSKNGDIFDAWVVKNLKPLLLENTKADFRFDIEKNVAVQDDRFPRSLIAVPLMIGVKILGVLRVDSLEENHFSTDDLRFLSRIADLGAVALESAQLYEHLQDLAIKDSLTGIYLRRYLMDRMTEELPRQLRRKEEMSFLMMDLDHFKKYNDHFGHVAGDIVLRTISDLLAKYFQQPGNIICRYGGEEFAVMLPDCSKAQAQKLAEDFRKEVAATEIVLRREKTTITVSIGIAAFPTDAQIKEELIQKADQALYQAKQKGRNRVCPA